MSLRVPLTPYDRLFLAGHLALRAAGLPGHPILAMLDLAGEPDAAALRAALSRAVQRHALLRATIGYSWLTGRAHWQLPRGEADVASTPAAPNEMVTLHDLRNEIDPDAAWVRLRHELLQLPLDPARPPHLHAHLVQRPAGRCTLVLRYGHYVMDLGGGWRLLRELAGETTAHGERDRSAADEAEVLREPVGNPSTWTAGRMRRWWRGMRMRRGWATRGAALLPLRREVQPGDGDGLQRCWPVEAGARIEAAARATCAAGPLLYTRHALICVAQALDELRAPLGLKGADYQIALPIARPNDPPRPLRPMNDLTIAVIRMPRALLADPAAADAHLSRQLDDYLRGGDQATWTLMGYAGWLRMRDYRRMMRSGRGLPRTTAGVTLFRVDDDGAAWRGARIENFSAIGLPTIPPAAMFTFSRFGRRWTLGISYFRQLLPPPLAEQMADAIERRMGAE